MASILFAEWVEHMECYRVYDEESPEWTIAYEEDINNAEDYADNMGYKLIVVGKENNNGN